MATPQKTPNRPAPAKQAVKPAAAPAKQATRPAPPPQHPVQPAPRPQAAPPAQAQVQRPPGTTVATPAQTAMAIREDVPDYIRGSQGRGSENVEMQDVVIPRIELVQAL